MSSTVPQKRILCVYAHPDDEVFCSGGTIAKYAQAGAEIMVVSATKGDAGQIRDAAIATRRTLGQARERELQLSCARLGAQTALCLDYPDGTLKDIPLETLAEPITQIIRQFQPDVIITFGPDGGYGHPDHIAISEATTLAAQHAGDPQRYSAQLTEKGLQPFRPGALFHTYFPQHPILMIESLSKWLMETSNVRSTQMGGLANITEFVRALLLFAEETTLLRYSSDRMDINWYPSGFYIIEQGEEPKDLYLILSGTAQAILEREDGSLTLLAELNAGDFFGERGIATRQKRSAHVVSKDNVTCLVLSGTEAVNFGGRGKQSSLHGKDLIEQTNPAELTPAALGYTHCLDVMENVYTKVSAMSAHRTQYPIMPDMFPLHILQELLGYEYFVQVLPKPEIKTDLFAA